MDVQNPQRSEVQSRTRLKNYYEILQVSPSVSRVQVREAFLRLKKTYSATSQALYSLVDDDDAHEALLQIEEAFRVLDDDHLRKEYDMQLKANGDRPLVGRTFLSDAVEGGALMGGNESLDSMPIVARRMPTLCKISPRVQNEEVRRRIEAIWSQADVGDGTVYKSLREAAGVDVKELYSQTKIIPEYIAAIESNDFSKLPALVYIKGFVRSYLQFLGVTDTAAAIQAFTEKWQVWESAEQH